LSQLLLGRDRDSKGGKLVDDLGDIQNLMLRGQQPDGSWKAAGQLPRQNRPEAETNEVTTMWAVLALASLDKRAASTEEGIQRAMDFLSKVKPGKSNESLIGALLVAHQFGKAQRGDDLLKELLSRQNPDGGWAWRQGGDSDALATGQALYALMHCGLSADHAAVRRARDYLIESQTEDGSWLVPSRAISAATDEARLKKLAPIYRYWGTAWATIGLSETLSDPRGKKERKEGVRENRGRESR
jgi:squalene-hopene/tetraprenyl-beta-curcumene cyclase